MSVFKRNEIEIINYMTILYVFRNVRYVFILDVLQSVDENILLGTPSSRSKTYSSINLCDI